MCRSRSRSSIQLTEADVHRARAELHYRASAAVLVVAILLAAIINVAAAIGGAL